MRKFSGVLLLFILICSQLTAQSKQLSLNDFFVNRTFGTKGVYGLRSMNDGEHYTRRKRQPNCKIQLQNRTSG